MEWGPPNSVQMRMRLLERSYRDDFPGRKLSKIAKDRLSMFCGSVRNPDTIAASEEGGVCASWRVGPHGLSVQFNRDGKAMWAGNYAGTRSYGIGTPSMDEWGALLLAEDSKAEAPK